MTTQTIDPSAAVITSVGGSASGGSMTSTTPVITGTADAGDVVTVYDGIRVLGTAVVAANGTWSFTPTTPLKAGSHSFAAIPVDSQGNHGASSNVVNVNVVASVPATPPAPTFSDDNGANIPAGSTTTDVTPHINGTGTAGDTITVYDNGTPIGTATVAGDGTWSFHPTTPLPSGNNSITVVDTNPAGTPSLPSNPSSLVINPVVAPSTPAAPTFTNDSGQDIPVGSTTADGHPHINGKGTAGDTVTVYDGSTVLGTAVVAANGTWTFMPASNLSNGPHSINVTEANSAGTSAHSPASALTVLTGTPATPPAPTLTDDNNASIPAGSTTTDGHPHISGTGTAGDTITVYDGSTVLGTAVVAGNGTWTFTPSSNVAPGTHSINVTDTNAAGTVSPHSPNTAFTLVAVPPVIVSVVDAVGPVQGNVPMNGYTDDTQPTFHGTGIAGDTIYLYDNGRGCGDTVVGADGTWTIHVNNYVDMGLNNITATQFAPGVPASALSNTWTFTLLTATPATPPAPILSDDNNVSIPAGSTTTDGHPHISGTGTAGDTITVYDGSTVLGTAVVAANGTWTFTPSSDVAPGTHSINVTDTNAAGAISPHSPNTPFTYSNVPATPAAPTFSDDNGANIPAGSTTTDVTPHINGTGTAGDTITVYDNGTAIGSATVAGDGTWSFHPTTPLPSGNNSITVVDTNPAGTPSLPSNPSSLVINPVVAPSTPAAPTFTNDSGQDIPVGSTTADGHPHINGKGTAGDTVTVYDGSTVLGTAVVAANGTWTFMPASDLSNGPHSINVTEANSAGTSAHSPASALTVLTGTPATPPAPILSDDNGVNIPAGSTTTDGHPHISGTGTAGDTITVYDGSTVLGTAVVAANGTWTFTPSSNVAPGTHSINVTDTNAAGTVSPHSPNTPFTYSNVAGAPVITSVVDAVGPVQGPVPNGGTTDDSQPTISGTGTAGDTIYIYQNGAGCAQTTVDSTGHWSVQITGALSNGVHAMTATQFASGQAESASSNTWTVKVDTTIPAAPSIGSVTDNVGPIVGPVPKNGTSDDNDPVITGQGVAGDVVHVMDNGVQIGSATVDGSGNWSFKPVTPLADGSHDITATQTNPATGATGPASSDWPFNIETSIPAPVITQVLDAVGAVTGPVPKNGTTDDNDPVISGTGKAGDVVHVKDNGVEIGSTTVDGSGNWSFKPPVTLAVGSHDLTATQTNPATGLTSSVSGDWPFSLTSPALQFQACANAGATQFRVLGTVNATLYVAASPNHNAIDNLQPGIAFAGSSGGYTGWTTSMGPILSNAYIFITYDNINFILVGQFNETWGNVNRGIWANLLPVTPLTSVLQAPADLPTDDHALAAVGASSDQTQSPDATKTTTTSTEHHTVVGEHDAFTGTTGHDTVDLNADPTSYFKESTAHIQGSTVHPTEPAGTAPAVNTLHLTGDHQVLDLTSLTGQTAAAKISGIEVIDLGGHANNLKLSLTDVLNLGETDLFQTDGHQQMMVNGSNGDTVDLSNSHIAGVADGQWQVEGTATVGGVMYNVYEHTGAHTELLVQQGVQVALHN